MHEAGHFITFVSSKIFPVYRTNNVSYHDPSGLMREGDSAYYQRLNKMTLSEMRDAGAFRISAGRFYTIFNFLFYSSLYDNYIDK